MGKKADIDYEKQIQICLKCQLKKCIYDDGNRNRKRCEVSDQCLKSVSIISICGNNVVDDSYDEHDQPYVYSQDVWINSWAVRYKYVKE